jgi:hypothetical protein
MSEGFDDFARKQEQEKQDKEQLARDAMSEWEIVLKGFVSQFAADVKGIGADRFQWEPYPSQRSASLVLGNMAATLYDSGERNGMPLRCHVLFDRRPLGPNKVWADPESPIAPKIWSLEPTVENGEFLWLVKERNLKVSSAKLADEIARELGERHIALQKAYEKWGL